MKAVFGSNTVVDGLSCTATSPPSLSVMIGPGSITQLASIDASDYGTLAADPADLIVKMGCNTATSTYNLVAPASVGQTINYLVEAAFLETDINPTVLPYYNASNPAQTFSGPNNSGSAQNTLRAQTVQIQVKPGVAADTGHQVTPAADAGWTPLYQVAVSYGQTQITASNISQIATAPFVNWKLPTLAPGFGSGVQTFASSGAFTVPAGVTQLEVEVWGGGSGSYASVAGLPSGGGAGGGYARKRITGMVPGQSVVVTVGAGGSGGTVAGAVPTAGGTSSFGSFVSATGGSTNYLATAAQPQNGATPGGFGVGGDVNLTGSAGQAGIANQGGLGGAAPFGGVQNSGTSANPGIFPGGGAAGAGTGVNSMTAYDGAAGAGGFVVVRW
ncbi:MAG TPA: hypothetical protein VHC04_15490 [Rhodopila sp.]|nr:hypothetical protein [Rhodopila sp.]